MSAMWTTLLECPPILHLPDRHEHTQVLLLQPRSTAVFSSGSQTLSLTVRQSWSCLPFLEKNSRLYFPAATTLRGTFPRSSMIRAMWSAHHHIHHRGNNHGSAFQHAHTHQHDRLYGTEARWSRGAPHGHTPGLTTHWKGDDCQPVLLYQFQQSPITMFMFCFFGFFYSHLCPLLACQDICVPLSHQLSVQRYLFCWRTPWNIFRREQSASEYSPAALWCELCGLRRRERGGRKGEKRNGEWGCKKKGREGKEERGEDVHKGERTQRLYREVRIENRERKVTCS